MIRDPKKKKKERAGTEESPPKREERTRVKIGFDVMCCAGGFGGRLLNTVFAPHIFVVGDKAKWWETKKSDVLENTNVVTNLYVQDITYRMYGKNFSNVIQVPKRDLKKVEKNKNSIVIYNDLSVYRNSRSGRR